MQRPVLGDGLGAVHLPRELARPRGLYAGAFGKLYHLGIRSRISRSTLADANESRDWRIYAEFAQALIDRARPLYANDPLELDLANTVYALDSTLIELCLSMFPWAHYQSKHAAVKLHTLVDLRGNIPSFLYVSDGKLEDVAVLDQLLPEPGAFYVLDRGYIDYARLYRFHQGRAFFVVRAKSNLKARRRYSHWVDRSTGLRSDHTVLLTGKFSRTHFPEPLRRVRIKDLSQIWIAVSVYVLVAIVKKHFQLPASLHDLLQILSVTLFEREPIDQILTLAPPEPYALDFSNQLTLFDF